MSDQFATPVPDAATQLALDRIRQSEEAGHGSDMAGLGFTGTVTDGGNGNTYGSWESADHKTLLAANRTDGQVQMEFNLLLPLAQN